MSKTKIEWTDETWNVTGGCTPVSAGCLNCAAARSARRCIGFGNDKYKGLVNGSKWTGEIRLYPDELEKPLHWKQQRRVFVDFMSDLFHPDVPFDFIDKVWAVMALCPDHTFQVLTKRPERMAEYINFITGEASDGPGGYPVQDHFSDVILDSKSYMEKATALEKDDLKYNHAAGRRTPSYDYFYAEILNKIEAIHWPLPNVWLGTTAENQEMANLRIPELLKCPAAKRFVSVEPMLGAVDLTKYVTLRYGKSPDDCNVMDSCGECNTYPCPSKPNVIYLDWVICGGESGPGARPMYPDWARSIRDQCKAAGVPFFFKQWGAWVDSDLTEVKGNIKNAKIMFPDGSTVLWQDKPWNHYEFYERGGLEVVRVGKKKAGSLLDGAQHKEMPI
ncbi:MAG TPA: phage Gp37/Gp68 family protein [Phycisphaerales bacterium]|nr:phage Gp37/Gp68 family protein [Phycisphaerales bacterium]